MLETCCNHGLELGSAEVTVSIDIVAVKQIVNEGSNVGWVGNRLKVLFHGELVEEGLGEDRGGNGSTNNCQFEHSTNLVYLLYFYLLVCHSLSFLRKP